MEEPINGRSGNEGSMTEMSTEQNCESKMDRPWLDAGKPSGTRGSPKQFSL